MQDVLQLLGENPNARWGVYLRIPTQQLLEASLTLLHSAYSEEKLYRPVWISMEGLQSSDNTKVHSIFLSDSKDLCYIQRCEKIFIHILAKRSKENISKGQLS